MDIKIILIAVLVLAALGSILAAFLSYASKVFHVKVDRRVAAVREALPGANCGACGFPGCDGLAEEIALRDGPINGCPVGGAPVAEAIAEIMGKTAVAGEKNVACVMCQGDNERAKNKFNYDGITSCSAANALHGGQKSCSYGCLGFGDCKAVCEFGAISIENGLAVIDKEKCTSCGLCISACPKAIIELIPYAQDVIVKCKSHDNGKETRSKCSVGCIGCQICVKMSEPGAFSFENFLAKREFASGADPAKGLEKCPTKAIFPGLELKAKAEAEKAAAAKAKAEAEKKEVSTETESSTESKTEE